MKQLARQTFEHCSSLHSKDGFVTFAELKDAVLRLTGEPPSAVEVARCYVDLGKVKAEACKAVEDASARGGDAAASAAADAVLGDVKLSFSEFEQWCV